MAFHPGEVKNTDGWYTGTKRTTELPELSNVFCLNHESLQSSYIETQE